MEYEVSTKYGSLRIAPTDDKHIHVGLGADFTVSTVVYRGGIHMYKWNDGDWHYGVEFEKQADGQMAPASKYKRKDAIWLRRSDWLERKSGFEYPTNPVWLKIVAEVVVVATRWAVSHPEELHEALVEALKCKYSDAIQARDEAEKAFGEALRQVEALEKELSEK